jgi:formiminotetrahydrofolate cyclodeaminase
MIKAGSTSIGKLTVEQYLADLGSDKPAPGGGAATAICAAQGAALLSMCLNVSGKNEETIPNLRFDELLNYLTNARRRFLEIADKDARAFENVMALYTLPKSTDDEKKKRKAELQAAFKNAAEIPFSLMELAADILDNANDVIKATKASVISDAAIGIDFLFTALKSSRHNVRINLNYIKDEVFVTASESRIKLLTSGRSKQKNRMQETVKEILTSR